MALNNNMSEEDLAKLGVKELVRRVRAAEAEKLKLLQEHSNAMKEINKRLHVHLLEIRGLKEVNRKLSDDNQELRDLCCFLDDDRQKSRKLAREWQRFGRYTAQVMRSEVATYQEKLRELEARQRALVAQNSELKELCILLDEERAPLRRDQGDGAHSDEMASEGSGDRDNADYVRRLEERIRVLEEEKRLLAQRVERKAAEGEKEDAEEYGRPRPGLLSAVPRPASVDHVSQSMKVWEIHDQLDTDSDTCEMDDDQKALLRQLCVVAWKKLGEDPVVLSSQDAPGSVWNGSV